MAFAADGARQAKPTLDGVVVFIGGVEVCRSQSPLEKETGPAETDFPRVGVKSGVLHLAAFIPAICLKESERAEIHAVPENVCM